MIFGVMALAACGEHREAHAVVLAEPAPRAPALPGPASASPATSAPSPAAADKAPSEAPRRGSKSADDSLIVKRLVVARGVKNREPVDPTTTFDGATTHKVYAFVEVENRGSEPGEILVEFEPPGGGGAHGDITLAVGAAPRWRTWAYTRTVNTPGSWTAVVKNKRGEALARAPFEVTP
jgi:hypothetical protein